MLKILYRPVHSILEYDQLLIFRDLGYDVFSVGSYVNPDEPQDPKRPPIPGLRRHGDLMRLLREDGFDRDKPHPELIHWADVILVDHLPEWLVNNWPAIRHKVVVWRTIGQSAPWVEAMLAPLRRDGLLVVRYSEREETIPGYIGKDALIRFAKDPAEFCGWHGSERRVITVGQSLPERGEFCHYKVFQQATAGLSRAVFGPGNEGCGEIWGGELTYDELKEQLRAARCFFYTGTQPASYTLGFIEAMMTGTPIVAIGPALGNSLFRDWQNTYQVHEFIRHGHDGFYSDSIPQLRQAVKMLLERPEVAAQISRRAREKAVSLFNVNEAKERWRCFFDTRA